MFRLYRSGCTFADLSDVRVAIGGGLNRDTHLLRCVFAFDEKIFRIEKLAVVTDVELLK